MKILTSLAIAVSLSACATSQSFDRDSRAWASTIVGCQSAAALAGTQSDQAVWAYEKQELLNDRNGGWPSDRARLGNAVKENTAQLSNAGSDAASQKLSQCQRIVKANFPEGHPAG